MGSREERGEGRRETYEVLLDPPVDTERKREGEKNEDERRVGPSTGRAGETDAQNFVDRPDHLELGLAIEG